MGCLYLLDGVSLIEMETALHADTWPPFQSPKHKPSSVSMHWLKQDERQHR